MGGVSRSRTASTLLKKKKDFLNRERRNNRESKERKKKIKCLFHGWSTVFLYWFMTLKVLSLAISSEPYFGSGSAFRISNYILLKRQSSVSIISLLRT